MAFRKLNEQVNLTGFYRREKGNVIEGLLVKYVAKKNGPFFILELEKSCKLDAVVLEADGTPRVDPKTKRAVTKAITGKKGDMVGLSACATVKPLSEYVGRLVQAEWKGEKPSTEYKGKMIQIYEIAVDEPDAA